MIIKKFLKGVDSVTNFWISFTLAVMLVVILLDIVLREVFGSPLTWHLEMSQYCLINVAYIGAAVAHRQDGRGAGPGQDPADSPADPAVWLDV